MLNLIPFLPTGGGTAASPGTGVGGGTDCGGSGEGVGGEGGGGEGGAG